MKKRIFLASTFACLCCCTLVLGLIFLDPYTTAIVWLLTFITSIGAFAYFFANSLNNTHTTELKEIKEKLTQLQNEPYKGPPSNVVHRNRYKGKIEGLKIAIEILEKSLNKNQQ